MTADDDNVLSLDCYEERSWLGGEIRGFQLIWHRKKIFTKRKCNYLIYLSDSSMVAMRWDCVVNLQPLIENVSTLPSLAFDGEEEDDADGIALLVVTVLGSGGTNVGNNDRCCWSLLFILLLTNNNNM